MSVPEGNLGIPDIQGFMDNTSSLDPSLYNLSGTNVAGFDLGGQQGGLLYDTMTGQFVTQEQARQLDPGYFSSTPFGKGIESTYTPGGSQPPAGSGWNANDIAKILSGVGGLATAGLGIGGIAQGLSGGAQQGTSSTGNINQTKTTVPGPMSPELQSIFSQLGGTQYGGLQGLAGMGMQQNMAPTGLMNQQQNALNYAAGSLPAPNQQLNQNLIANAQGMATGGLPSLSPQLQQQVSDIYGSQWANIDRYLQNYLGNVRDQMNNQGWEGGQYDVLRQGPGQALFAPALQEATRQQGLLAGQAAQSSLNLAQALPNQALQLGTGVFNQDVAAQQSAQNLASAFNQPIQTRNQVPLSLFQGLNQNRGDVSTLQQGSSTQNMQAPMSLMDAFGQATKVLGGLGGLAGGINGPGSPTGTQQQLPLPWITNLGSNGGAGTGGTSY